MSSARVRGFLVLGVYGLGFSLGAWVASGLGAWEASGVCACGSCLRLFKKDTIFKKVRSTAMVLFKFFFFPRGRVLVCCVEKGGPTGLRAGARLVRAQGTPGA
jgi:hypothetical protein